MAAGRNVSATTVATGAVRNPSDDYTSISPRAGFIYNLDDKLLLVDDTAVPYTSLATNVDNTIHAGIEAVFGYNHYFVTPGLHSINSMVSITVNEFRFDNDAVYGDNELPAAPGRGTRGELL